MNLIQITARIGELSAELLTLHKDLAHLVEGTVNRQTSVRTVTSFHDFRDGDKVKLREVSISNMLSNDGTFKAGEVYKVCDIETPNYSGRYNVLIESQSGESACWVNYNILDLVA